MEMRRLGANGPEISVVGYGAWEAGGKQWGSGPGDDEVVAAMRAGIEAGMTWIDTAEAYGGGHSEELVGRVAREHRDVLVFTKVAPFGSGIHPKGIAKAIRDSLRRLSRDHVDLYQIHWPDEEEAALEDSWAAMADLVDQGLTRWIGVSNFDREQVERCEGVRHVDSVQNQFSLLHQDDAAGFLPWLERSGTGYLGYGPLAFGLLTGAIHEGTVFDEGDWRGGGGGVSYYEELFAPDKLGPNVDKVEALREVAERVQVPLPSLALRAAIETDGLTAVIAGSRNARHTEANAEAGGLKLDPEVLAEVRAIFA